MLESLAKAGALDSLAPPDEPITSRRARLCAAIDRALEHGNRIQKDRDRGQTQLFDAMFGGDDGDDDGAVAASDLALPDAEPLPTAQVLAFEKEALGLYLSGHPLAAHQDDLAKAGARPIGQCTEAAADVLVGGIISGVRQVKTKKGDRMAAFMLEDLDASLEVVAFPETFRNFAPRDRERPHGAGAGQARSRRRHREDPGQRDQAAVVAQRDARRARS